VDSPKELKTLLYDELKFPTQYGLNSNKERKVTTDAKALTSLEAKFHHPILALITRYRSLRTIKSTMLESIPTEGGRMRTSYGTTENGRLSSKVRWDKTGMNLLNIPKRGEDEELSKNVRVLFKALPGWEVMEIDLSQAEARVVAWESNCLGMKKEFSRPGGDVFKLLGSFIYGCTFDQVTKPQRELCKRTVHGSDYLMGPQRFSELLGVSVAEGRPYQEHYFRLFPEVREGQEEIRVKLVKDRKLKNSLGRERIFLDRIPYSREGGFGKETWKEGAAFGPQGTVGDYLNQALIKLYYCLPSPGEIWLQV
jgi:DNA polymerase-1